MENVIAQHYSEDKNEYSLNTNIKKKKPKQKNFTRHGADKSLTMLKVEGMKDFTMSGF